MHLHRLLGKLFQGVRTEFLNIFVLSFLYFDFLLQGDDLDFQLLLLGFVWGFKALGWELSAKGRLFQTQSSQR